MRPLTRLEIGSGHRPTPGYVHCDINDFDGIDLVCPAWEVDLPSASLSEVLALGVIEHLAFVDVEATFANVARMLHPGGQFLFDVPDLPVWCRYLYDSTAGRAVPFAVDHILATLYGWQRWPGDEHRSGWTRATVHDHLRKAGFGGERYGVAEFLSRGHDRRRFHRPADAHIYVVATR